MILNDFIRHKTNARELCVIRDCGWIVATCWIDNEDLCLINQNLVYKEVLKDSWGTLLVVNEHNDEVRIPCHYIDIEWS